MAEFFGRIGHQIRKQFRRREELQECYQELKPQWKEATRTEKLNEYSVAEHIVKRMFELEAAMIQVQDTEKKYSQDTWAAAPYTFAPEYIIRELKKKFDKYNQRTEAKKLYKQKECALASALQQFECDAYGAEVARSPSDLENRRAQLNVQEAKLNEVYAESEPWVVAVMKPKLNPVTLAEAISTKIQAIDTRMGRAPGEPRRILDVKQRTKQSTFYYPLKDLGPDEPYIEQIRGPLFTPMKKYEMRKPGQRQAAKQSSPGSVHQQARPALPFNTSSGASQAPPFNTSSGTSHAPPFNTSSGAGQDPLCNTSSGARSPQPSTSADKTIPIVHQSPKKSPKKSPKTPPHGSPKTPPHGSAKKTPQGSPKKTPGGSSPSGVNPMLDMARLKKVDKPDENKILIDPSEHDQWNDPPPPTPEPIPWDQEKGDRDLERFKENVIKAQQELARTQAEKIKLEFENKLLDEELEGLQNDLAVAEADLVKQVKEYQALESKVVALKKETKEIESCTCEIKKLMEEKKLLMNDNPDGTVEIKEFIRGWHPQESPSKPYFGYRMFPSQEDDQPRITRRQSGTAYHDTEGFEVDECREERGNLKPNYSV